MSEQQPADTEPETETEPDTSSESSGSDSPDTGSDTGADTGGGAPGVESGVPGDVGDDQLPEDLQPHEDNPLARHPDQTGDEDDQIGADREEDPETAPLHAEEADYGSGAG